MFEKNDFYYSSFFETWLNLKVYSEASHGENQLKREQGL